MARKRASRRDVALQVVCNIGWAVAAEMDLPALLELIYREAGRVMSTDCFAMALYDPLEEGLRFELLYDREVRLPPLLRRRGEGWGLAGRVFEERRPLLYTDLREENLPDGAIRLGDVPQSWLGVPLVAHERVIGVMSVQSYEADAFGRADQTLLEAIASQAAVAIENLFLRREHERRIVELSVLNEVGRAILMSSEIEDLLGAIYRETSRVMDTANLYVALYHPAEEMVTFDFFMEDGERVSKPPLRLSDGGLTVHIVTSRQPLLVEEDLERRLEGLGIQPVGRPAQSYLGVPMVAGNQVVGVLAVQNPTRRRAYDHRHQDLLSNIANLAAVAIENIRLSQERQQRLLEQETLNEIGRVLASSMELDTLFERVHEEIGRVFDTTNFYIGTCEEETDEWTLAFAREHGLPDPRVGGRFKVDAGLTGYMICRREPLLFRSMEETIAFHRDHDIPAIGETAVSWMGVPLIAADKVVGAMAVQSYEQENLYDEEDLAFFRTIAAQVAVAIDNARLLQGWQERVTDLSILNEVAQAILTAETHEELLETIYRQVSRVLDATHFYMALCDEVRQELDFTYYIDNGERVAGPGRVPISEGGLTVYTVQQRQPLFLVANVDGQLAELGISGRGRPAKSFIGVPMIAGDQVVGALAVQNYDREYAFTSRHFALLINIATQSALAVQRIRLRASGARQARQLAIIGDVSRKVTAILDLDELLRELARSIQLGFGYSNVAVFRVEEEVGELVLGALVGRYAGIVDWGYRQPIGEGLAGWAAREGKPVLCNDVTKDPRFVRGFDAEELTLAELCVPISYAGRVIGVLDIQAEKRDAFDPEDLAAMGTLAGQLAAAMRNAILFRERGEQLANLNALNQVIEATAMALSLEDLLTAVCGVVAEVMSPDGFFVVLRSPDGAGLTAPFVMEEGIFRWNVPVPQLGLADYMVRIAEPVLIRNMVEEAEDYAVEVSFATGARMAASWLGVPLRSADTAIGGIVVQSYRPFAFGERDVEFLQSLANQIVVSIEKARLFDETQRALEEVRQASEQQRRLLDMVRELSTPLVPIAEGILVLPLVGTIDSRRAQQIMDVLLEGISSQRARVVILDITGVPIVDTSVANYLLQATQAVRLLGAECVLVGITPEVAQTVVGLGVSLQGLITRSDLQGGVEYALRQSGKQIVKLPKGSRRKEEDVSSPRALPPGAFPTAPSQ